jgi:hypothetical protein
MPAKDTMPACARPSVPWQLAQDAAKLRACKGSVAWALAQADAVSSNRAARL